MQTFDVLVIGSGPAGQKAAIQAAKGGKRVVLVEKHHAIGGACVHRGTIPSKTLREAALQLADVRRVVQGTNFALESDFAVKNLMGRLDAVLDQHEVFWRDQLTRNNIVLVSGDARFESATVVEVSSPEGSEYFEFSAAIIATGSRPRHPEFVSFDDKVVFDSDSILGIEKLPRSMIVLGAGVIAAEYASIFACLGVKVTMVDNGSRPIAFIDPELTSQFLAAFASSGGEYIPGVKPIAVRRHGSGAEVDLDGDAPRTLAAASVLVALGRVANADELNLECLGVKRCGRGNIIVDEAGWTGVEAIYAVGDVIGPPSLASTSMDQGRRAARAILGLATKTATDLIPAGVYTIPEISCVGMSEEAVRAQYGDAIVGRAHYAEVARGCIRGDREGLVKIVVEPTELKLVGVHIVGAGAAELVHVGQVAIISGWGIDDLIDNVFNFPTFAEAYRIAALDAAKAARAAAERQDGVVRMRRASAMAR